MKLTIIYLIIIIFSLLCYSQVKDTSDSFKEYIEILQKYNGKPVSEFFNMPDSVFRLIVKTAYKAYETSSSEILEYTINNQEALSTNYEIWRLIASKHSFFLNSFVRIPVLVRAKVLSARLVTVEGHFGQMNLLLEPEYILKGNEQFLESNFEVYYRNYESVPDHLDYKIGNSYLFPLWDRGEVGNEIFAIATWMDKNGSRFLIENEMVIDRYNFFSSETFMSWEKLKKTIENIIYRIENELPLEDYKNPVIFRRPRR